MRGSTIIARQREEAAFFDRMILFCQIKSNYVKCGGRNARFFCCESAVYRQDLIFFAIRRATGFDVFGEVLRFFDRNCGEARNVDRKQIQLNIIQLSTINMRQEGRRWRTTFDLTISSTIK